MPDWRLEGPAIGEDAQGLLWRFSVPEVQQVRIQIPRCSFRFPNSSPIITLRIPPRYSPPNTVSKLLPKNINSELYVYCTVHCDTIM